MKLSMIVDKVCKHSVRYSTDEEGAAVESVYVKKSWLGTPHPEEIEVVIRKPEEGE